MFCSLSAFPPPTTERAGEGRSRTNFDSPLGQSGLAAEDDGDGNFSAQTPAVTRWRSDVRRADNHRALLFSLLDHGARTAGATAAGPMMSAHVVPADPASPNPLALHAHHEAYDLKHPGPGPSECVQTPLRPPPLGNGSRLSSTSKASSQLLMGSFTIIIASALTVWTLLSKEPQVVHALDSGVAKLPVLGYNTWNAYHCDINETVVLQAAQLMVSLGLADVGYKHVNIDDCYAEKNRSASGDIVADKERFAAGMNDLTDKIHDMGLKAGIYSDSGWFTCQLYPGSYQNEARDAKLFQDWGFDYLKFDNCAIPYDEIIREGIVGKYKRMADAIAELAQTSGKPPLIFSLCEWGEEQPWLWARRYGQSWRTTGDISPDWGSIASIINQNSFIAWASDFHGHNDMDILEIGNGDLTHEEAKTHFTAWALMKSPLLIGTDLSTISDADLAILKNEELLAISQDAVVGTSVTPFRWGINPDWVSNSTHPAQFWSGESQNGTVFMLINTLDEPADMSFNLTESPWIRAGRQYAVRDLWTHTANGTAVRNFTARAVPAHGVVALLLRDAGDEPAGAGPPCARPEWCIGRNGTLAPGA